MVVHYPFRAVGEAEASVSGEEYMRMVEKGISHAKRGDVFQIVLSRRFCQSFSGDDFNVYRALRCVNPSPYLFYFDFGSFRVFGSSPETHLRVERRDAYIDPIAGTFRRTGDDVRDHDLPEDAVKVSESGIHSAEQILQLRQTGFRGFLMGQAFMEKDNPAEALKGFIKSLNH